MALLLGIGPTAGLALLVVVVFSASPAAAQTDPDELARQHFESGAAYFEQAEYESALREFEKSYELSQRPPILRNISIVHERLGNWCEAVESFDRFLAAGGEAQNAATAKIRRYNLRKRWTKSGKPCLRDMAAGESAPVGGQGLAAAENSQAARLAQGVRQHSVVGAEQMEPDRTWAVTSLAVGAAAGLGAIGFGLAARAEHDALQEGESCAPNCSDEDVSTGENLALVTDVLLGVSIVGIGLGTWLWFDAEDPPERLPQVAVVATPSGAYAQARWRF